MSRPRVLLAFVALVLGTPACSLSVGKLSYPSGNYPTTVSPSPSKAVVAVLPFEDARGWSKQSALMLWPIPLVPFVTGTFERPEAAEAGEFTPNYTCTPTEDLPKAVAAELERERLVARTFFSFGGDDMKSATHELRGRIDAFEFKGTVLGYGLSYYAYVLWGLGLPRSYRDNRIDLTLELRDRASQEVVWSATLRDADSLLEGYYYGSPTIAIRGCSNAGCGRRSSASHAFWAPSRRRSRRRSRRTCAAASASACDQPRFAGVAGVADVLARSVSAQLGRPGPR